jgi:RNA polymerase sigma factor (sigma-70 family)
MKELQQQDKEDEFSPRIDAIETQWSMVRRAHQGTISSGSHAKSQLVMRYASAIRGYVQAMTRSEQEADELSQDVYVRILNGDFAGADPQRGRFRDLLKVAVRNMVRNHWQKQNRRRPVDFDVEQVEGIAETESVDEVWLENWRHNLLEITWDRLKSYQESHAGSIAHTVLKLRSEYPSVDSKELAARLSALIGREIRPDTTRQQLRRSRIRFAELLVEEIASGLEDSDPERIQEELISLGLYEHIRDVLPNSWSSSEKK